MKLSLSLNPIHHFLLFLFVSSDVLTAIENLFRGSTWAQSANYSPKLKYLLPNNFATLMKFVARGGMHMEQRVAACAGLAVSQVSTWSFAGQCGTNMVASSLPGGWSRCESVANNCPSLHSDNLILTAIHFSKNHNLYSYLILMHIFIS